jgi:hypothetical protein
MVYTRTVTFSDVFDCNKVQTLCNSMYDATFPTKQAQTFVAPCPFGNFCCFESTSILIYTYECKISCITLNKGRTWIKYFESSVLRRIFHCEFGDAKKYDSTKYYGDQLKENGARNMHGDIRNTHRVLVRKPKEKSHT